MDTKLTANSLKSAESVFNMEFTELDDNELIDNNNPENIVIKQDNFSKLSIDAKEVIDVVLSTPIDIISLITTKHGNVSKTQVRNYFKAKFGKIHSKAVFAELANYVSGF